jgi:hypothetical protein
MTQNSYAHVGCATIILGGFGLLLFGVGLDELSASRMAQAGGYLLGAGAVWGFLGFLWLLNLRANARRAWVARQPWKGAVVSWVLVLIAHAAAYFAVFQPALSGDLRTPAMSLAFGILPLCHLVVPIVGGFLWSAWVGSSKPKS